MKKLKCLILILLLIITMVGCGTDKDVTKTGNIENASANFNIESAENTSDSIITENTGDSNDKVNSDSTDTNIESKSTTHSQCRIDVLNVGQGSSTLVELDGKFMLIDGGDSDKSSYVVSYLKKRGVKKLDYVVATHYDSDHLNGIVGALNVFEVKNVWAPAYTDDTRVYKSFQKTVTESKHKVVCPPVGSNYNFGAAKLTIVAPNGKKYQNVNDYSIGIKFTYYKNSFIVCGDATNVSENEVVNNGQNLKSDIYIVNHHGSSHSTTMSFLNKVNPKYAVISAGVGNSYGHPAKQTLKRLRNKNIDIYRTDKQKEILITMDGENIKFNQGPYNKIESGNNAYINKDNNSGSTAGNKSNNSSGDTNNNIKSKNNKNNNSASNIKCDYILNSSTKKIHNPSCSAIKRMSEKNTVYYNGKIEDLITQGYDKCKMCFVEQ